MKEMGLRINFGAVGCPNFIQGRFSEMRSIGIDSTKLHLGEKLVQIIKKVNNAEEETLKRSIQMHTEGENSSYIVQEIKAYKRELLLELLRTISDISGNSEQNSNLQELATMGNQMQWLSSVYDLFTAGIPPEESEIQSQIGLIFSEAIRDEGIYGVERVFVGLCTDFGGIKTLLDDLDYKIDPEVFKKDIQRRLNELSEKIQSESFTVSDAQEYVGWIEIAKKLGISYKKHELLEGLKIILDKQPSKGIMHFGLFGYYLLEQELPEERKKEVAKFLYNYFNNNTNDSEAQKLIKARQLTKFASALTVAQKYLKLNLDNEKISESIGRISEFLNDGSLQGSNDRNYPYINIIGNESIISFIRKILSLEREGFIQRNKSLNKLMSTMERNKIEIGAKQGCDLQNLGLNTWEFYD